MDKYFELSPVMNLVTSVILHFMLHIYNFFDLFHLTVIVKIE